MSHFPSLLGHLLDPKEEQKFETKNKKEEPKTAAPDLPAIGGLVVGVAPPPLPLEVLGQALFPMKGADRGEPTSSGQTQVPNCPAAAGALEGHPLPAQLIAPEIESPVPGVSPKLDGLQTETETSIELPQLAATGADTKSAEDVSVGQSGGPPRVTVRLGQAEATPRAVLDPLLQSVSDTRPIPDEVSPQQSVPPGAKSEPPLAMPASSAPRPFHHQEEINATAQPIEAPMRARSAGTAAPHLADDFTTSESSVGMRDLAFAARLIPIEKGLRAYGVPGSPGRPAPPATVPMTPLPGAESDRTEKNTVPPKTGAIRHALPEAETDPGAKRPESAPVGRVAADLDHALTVAAQSAPAHEPGPAPARLDRAAAPNAPHRVPADLPPEAPQPASPARDIRLQVNGEQRVDVRLTERAGEVQVAVRTQDPRLTGALRDELPALSARLEQSGFRAEAWHPDTQKPEAFLRANESQAPGGWTDDRQPGRHGGRQQQESPARQPAQPPNHGDSPPKEFSWLFSSLK